MSAHLPKYLTQDELKRFSGAIPSPRNRALFALVYHYGLRVDEATMLTLEDVDHLGHKNIRNTRIYAQISHPLREQVFRDLECHPKIVRIA